MTEIDTLEGVQTLRKGGRVYYYHRATRTKLPGEPGSPEFQAALDTARSKHALKATEGTLAALIAQYQATPKWRSLGPKTRENYTTNLKAVIEAFGATPIQFLSLKSFRRDVLRWRDKYAAEHPRAANAKVSILSTILSWADDQGEITANPLRDISRTYKVDRSNIIWDVKDIELFNSTASISLQKALLLASDTGQRSGDLIAMRWADYDGKAIRIRQGKTKRWVYIPVTKALRAMLDEEKRQGPFILTNTKGRPWTSDNFKRSFRAARSRVKLDHLHFHDLRGTCVTRLAEAGCTVPEIAAITGHSIQTCQKIIDTYMKRTDNLAEAAIIKLERFRAKTSKKVAEKFTEEFTTGKSPVNRR